jgi:hypothetical protein
MQPLHRLLRHHRGLATLLVALALFARAMVPAGTMPVAHSLSVRICADSIGQTITRTISIPGKADLHNGAQHHDGVCAFSSLAMGAARAADLPVMPAPPLVARAAYLLPAVTAPPAAAPRLLPPLRGPPLQA